MNKILIAILKAAMIIGIGYHLLPISVLLSKKLTYLTMPFSYIHYMDLPKLGTDRSKKILDYFNSLGYYASVSYKGYRPIVIVERPLEDDILGLATPLPVYCLIVLNENMHEDYLFMTLLHEYVHCFNYDHIEDIKDLMYPSNNYLEIEEESIKKYANEIGKIINFQ